MRSKVFIGSRLIAIVEHGPFVSDPAGTSINVLDYIRIEAIANEPAVPVISITTEAPTARPKSTGSSFMTTSAPKRNDLYDVKF